MKISEEEKAKHKKKQPKRKRYKIAMRMIDPPPGLEDWGNWSNTRNYTTEEQRDVALETLQKKDCYGKKTFEYRKGIIEASTSINKLNEL